MARRAASFSFWEGSGDKTVGWRQYEVWTWHKTNITFTTSAHARTDRVRQHLDACDCRWGGENPDFAEPPTYSATSLKRLCVFVTHVKRKCVYTRYMDTNIHNITSMHVSRTYDALLSEAVNPVLSIYGLHVGWYVSVLGWDVFVPPSQLSLPIRWSHMHQSKALVRISRFCIWMVALWCWLVERAPKRKNDQW